MFEWWWAYLALGAFVGFFAGLLGIGGGAAMVPVLAFIYAAKGFDASPGLRRQALFDNDEASVACELQGQHPRIDPEDWREFARSGTWVNDHRLVSGEITGLDRRR